MGRRDLVPSRDEVLRNDRMECHLVVVDGVLGRDRCRRHPARQVGTRNAPAVRVGDRGARHDLPDRGLRVFAGRLEHRSARLALDRHQPGHRTSTPTFCGASVATTTTTGSTTVDPGKCLLGLGVGVVRRPNIRDRCSEVATVAGAWGFQPLTPCLKTALERPEILNRSVRLQVREVLSRTRTDIVSL